ncbi:hypothetical protein LBMAG48_26980 [Phycisphaerae bacterium]|nr:hypothetical protein LBMAG48_26980 [Phycisphaerae bacterium]
MHRIVTQLHPDTWFLASYAAMFGLLAFDLPYAVYQFARIAWLVAGLHCCVLCYRTAPWCVWPALALFVLMQPVFKIPMDKESWRVVDLIAMAGLLFVAFAHERKMRSYIPKPSI